MPSPRLCLVAPRARAGGPPVSHTHAHSHTRAHTERRGHTRAALIFCPSRFHSGEGKLRAAASLTPAGRAGGRRRPVPGPVVPSQTRSRAHTALTRTRGPGPGAGGMGETPGPWASRGSQAASSKFAGRDVILVRHGGARPAKSPPSPG